MADGDALQERLSFIQMDEGTRRALDEARPVIEAALPASLDRFYDQVRRTPQTRRFFQDDGHMAGAKAAQVRHWSGLASGTFSAGYAESVQRIGHVHARIGLEPRWYIGGYAMVLADLAKALVKDDAKRRRRWGGGDDGAALGERIGALVKAALLDMDFSISVYLEAAETARREAEAQREEAERQQAQVVAATGRGLSALAQGDLTFRLREPFPGDYERLRTDFNAAMQQLQDALNVIAVNVDGMTAGARDISQAADSLSQRTEQQAATLEETAAALEEITVTVRRTAEAANEANSTVLAAKGDAEQSGHVVDEAVAAMNGIEQSSGEIGQIIGVIDEIAFQTNLLALNAGVEAARAGDAGKGFAVVASEVRALAQRSAEAAKEIKALVAASTTQVNSGVELVGRTGETLRRIAGQVERITGLVSEIAASAQEQATGLAQVNTAVAQLDQMTQQNAAMVEQSTAAGHTLAEEARELAGLTRRFKVDGAAEAAPAPRTLAPRSIGATALKADDWEEF
ncbi:MAG: methyl-accepting chemotaxis protein [Pseudomonadota bacterium]